MARMYAARRRVRYELTLVVVLALAAALLALERPGGTEPERATEPPVEGEMFQWKPGQYVLVQRGGSVSNEIDESRFSALSVKNAADLAAWAQMAWENQWGYVWGTFGNVLDEQLLSYKLEQFGDAVGEYEDIIREKWMGRRVVDCAGLIKSYAWYDAARHSIEYASGQMPDMGTDGFFDSAPDSGPIDTLPETPGLLVYAEGHIGVYVGGGWAVEAISHAGGVVKTRVADRTWTHWLQCPYIQY